MTEKNIRVIASVITKTSKYLVCKRPENKRHGGLWEFPGGKIRDGESNLEAAIRELSEELKVQVAGVGDHLFTAKDPNSPYSIEFIKVDIEGEPQPIEHSEILWCTRTDMKDLQFAPADTKFINEYLLKEAL